jgi:SAM-dependent methyltransferase
MKSNATRHAVLAALCSVLSILPGCFLILNLDIIAHGKYGCRTFWGFRMIDTMIGACRRFLYPLLTTLFFAAPVLPFGGQAAYDVWQDQYVVPSAKGALLDAPYIATEYRFVDEMLRLLELRSGDVLYDLGCGDGRIVIEAAKRAHIRGVGIDIDPRRIAQSEANAAAANVSDRVVFLQQDLFESDIREATAVAIFLFPEMNRKLIPTFFRDLKPGTRIVSHNFGIGEWKADREVSLGLSGDGFHKILFWVLPANTSGVWQGRYKGELLTFRIGQIFQQIEGRFSLKGRGSLPISAAALTGDRIRFSFSPDKRTTVFEGRITGNTMEGVMKEAGTEGGVWKATRNPATVSRVYPGP